MSEAETMSNVWFPQRAFTGSHDFIFDTIQNDFKEQADLYRGDVNYLQLSPGAFKGRMLSAFLGNVAIHLEFCSQSVEKEICLAPSEFAFVVVIDDNAPILAYGGVTRSKDWVYVMPPGGECVTISPPECTVLVLKVARHALTRNSALLPEVAEWFERLNKRGEFVNSRWLADRIRADAFLALEGATACGGAEQRSAVDRAVVLSVVTAFTLEWLKHNDLSTFRSTPAAERFRLARQLLTKDPETFAAGLRPSVIDLGSRRSVEQAFSEQVKMGPLAYSRLLRLHNARRKLIDQSLAHISIGDIAADEGFWDWSRFTAHYHKQFGERPSETRNGSAIEGAGRRSARA